MDTLLEVNPVPKPRMTQSDKWKKRPCVLRYRDFCDRLRKVSTTNGYTPSNPLSLVFIIPMPKSWSKTKKDKMRGRPHQQRPDLDNLLKAFKDALLEEDSHIHTYLGITKVWGDEGGIIVRQ